MTSSSDENEKAARQQSTKKRKSFGRMSSVSKHLRAMSHELGSDCKCSMFECFKNIKPNEREKIITNFNLLGNWDDQSSYLTSLISVNLIVRRRPRVDDANRRDCSFRYIVRVKRDDVVRELPVCQKAFISLHGITKSRLETIQNSIKRTGQSPKDNRGKHKNRPWKLTKEKEDAVMNHIGSFKGRTSHYGKGRSEKIYLPEELSITKCFELYKAKYPDLPVSLETYRKIFNERFNLSFGYPRTDTCSACDKFQAELKGLNAQLSKTTTEEEKNAVLEQIAKITRENNVHKLKAVTFYTRKRLARKECQKDPQKEAICMDYQKNLPLPNIATNDVYYKRQLSFYSFNVHQLANRDAIFFTYTEDIGNKGANEVISFLDYYIREVLKEEVRSLVIFCDSCAGQNKNHALFLYLHYVVHKIKRLDSIKIVFPIRGHSYMECDKNIGLINKKTIMETPDDCVNAFKTARQHPQPFIVIPVEQNMIRDWTTFLKDHYNPKCPFKTRPIREAIVEKDDNLFKYRNTFNGTWTSADVERSVKDDIPPELRPQGDKEFLWPNPAYFGKLYFNLTF